MSLSIMLLNSALQWSTFLTTRARIMISKATRRRKRRILRICRSAAWQDLTVADDVGPHGNIGVKAESQVQTSVGQKPPGHNPLHPPPCSMANCQQPHPLSKSPRSEASLGLNPPFREKTLKIMFFNSTILVFLDAIQKHVFFQ